MNGILLPEPVVSHTGKQISGGERIRNPQTRSALLCKRIRFHHHRTMFTSLSHRLLLISLLLSTSETRPTSPGEKKQRLC
jgi:hypothetical protein